MDNAVFVVSSDRYWSPFGLISLWVIAGSVFAVRLRRLAKMGRAAVGGSPEGLRVWKPAIALIVTLASLMWLGVLAWLIPTAKDFQAFRLPADEISEIRIDAYQEPGGVGRSQLIKTVTVSDPSQIA